MKKYEEPAVVTIPINLEIVCESDVNKNSQKNDCTDEELMRILVGWDTYHESKDSQSE